MTHNMASFGRGAAQHGAHTEISYTLRGHCRFYKECPCYNTYRYSEPDSAFQVPVFLQWFKRVICMNDSGRISASSSAFLSKEISLLRFCCVQTCLWWKDLYLSLEIQRHMVNVRAGQQSGVIDSGLVYQLSDRAILIFFFSLFYF